MRLIKYISILVVMVSLSSCSFTINTPAASPGVQTLVTKNPVGTKVGKAERKIWLGLAFGETDLSIMKAAKNGNITKIATVDSEIEIGFFNKTYRTIVTGTNDEPEPEKGGKKKRRRRSRRK